MSKVYLTVKGAAGLMDISERRVRQLIDGGELFADVKLGVGGNSGASYFLPLDRLDERLQLKYERKLRAAGTPTERLKYIYRCGEENPRRYLDLTDAEREEVSIWKTIIAEWQRGRESYAGTKRIPVLDSLCSVKGNRAAYDQTFIRDYSAKYPDLDISQSTLYRKGDF